MFVSLRKGQSDTNKSKPKDSGIARRMFTIVVTDAACWIPVIIIKILALAGVFISPTVNGWVSILLLPINSALNPFLYTISTSEMTFKWGCKDKI
jgi:hypothetical protein